MDYWIVGAGSVGREALDACLAADLVVAGFLDDGRAGRTVRGLPTFLPTYPPPGTYVVAIADPVTRQRLSGLLDGLGWDPTTVYHPRSVVAPETSIGVGGLLLANAYVSSSVTIGSHCQVHYNATVGHDVAMEDFVSVYPGANISGAVHIEEGATVGSNAVVLQERSIGRAAFVGAGAVVTRDVPAGAVVVGSPARPMR